MTSRSVIVVSIQKKGMCDDPGYRDTSPERDEIILKGVNCEVTEFLDWFFVMPKSDSCCRTEDVLIDSGGSDLRLKVGDTLSVEYEDYFSYWLEQKTKWALNQVRIDSMNALKLF